VTQVTKISDGGTVTVACKVPNGIILRAFELINTVEASPNGGREVKMAQQLGEDFTVFGPARPHGEQPKTTVVGGYALTRGIPAELWNKWYEVNKNTDLVRNKQIFAYERLEAVKGNAKEQAKVRSGMEPITPDSDPRIPRKVKTFKDGNIDAEEELETANAARS
jgi:hypothetical protein